MQRTAIPFGPDTLDLTLDDGVDLLSMPSPEPIDDPAAAIEQALDSPIGAPPLDELIGAALARKAGAVAAVVISDHTRPVPYKGDQGILWPIIRRLQRGGFSADRIEVLVGTGTHQPLTDAQLRGMLDERVFSSGVRVINHDSRDPATLQRLGRTRRGSEVLMNRRYLAADLRILTGLVESHFIAGASGGRKAVCPGLIGEETTYVFHSARMMDDPGSRDLNLDGNPTHEESLEVAKMAGVDFIVNVTLDKMFRPTGVFAGDLEQAHLAAYKRLREYVAIPVKRQYDVILTHAGFVGINHYQSVKACLAALPALKKNGHLTLVAANTDTDPIGSLKYRAVLHLLKLIGPERLRKLIFSPDWTFVPEQWEVQAWARIFERIPESHFVYYSPWMPEKEYHVFPGVDGNIHLPAAKRWKPDTSTVQAVLDGALSAARKELAGRGVANPAVAFLYDGPYGILDPRVG
ncbi:MAG: nickel-dependent lactate racemase [Deltaproteobacteria bacterium]|nr:nickel-dependent lactate racemase [Deltaproteobacteria bacterium]